MKKTFRYLFSKAFCVASEVACGNTLYRLGGSKGVKFKNKIKYCADDNLYFNVCRPETENADKLPVFLYIHGGGFVSGAPDFRRAIMSNIAAAGYFVVGVFYGLAPKYIFPNPVENIYKALAFLKRNAAEYNIDIGRIFLGGESAGATLAVTLGAISSNNEYKEFFDLSTESKDLTFKAVVSICGLFDMTSSMDSGYPYIREYICAYADKTVEEVVDGADSAYMSPIRFINKGFPPTFVITGERCAFTPESERLIARLDECGVKNARYHGTGAESVHAYSVGQLLPIAKQSVVEMLKFIGEFKDV
ncbi:MAG: alpha/beta hydrolase [Clostridiales bacterium]|jgi:acetyl esterase/lipase|nr:alpha/beta hydrolase [Clostridiales bacterium]